MICAIYIIKVFHSVSLVLNTVTSILQHPENEPKKIETPKQDGSLSVTPRQAIQVSKEKETTKENKEKGF